MEITIFEGELRMGDGANATMVFAKDFRVEQCALNKKRLIIECEGVEILGPIEQQLLYSHSVFLDHQHVGWVSENHAELGILPAVDAGLHRVAIHVSTFPGFQLCDDFVLKKVVFQCDD